METEQTHNKLELSTFRVEGQWFGMDVLRVQEVMTPMKISALPLAPEYVVGLINVRGLIVTSISLKHRLGFDHQAYSEDYHNIIAKTDEGPVCLMVDEIGDVFFVDEKDHFSRPDTVNKVANNYISGVFKMDDRLVTVLSVDSICAP